MRTKDPIVGEAVVSMRKALGMTQQALADVTKKDRTHIAAIESGRIKAKSPDTRRALASAFALSLDDLDELLGGRLTAEDAMQRRNEDAAPKQVA